jgi:hypothetical protein
MKPIRVSRRQILGGLLLSPVATLLGCGSSGNPNAVTTAPGNTFTDASTPTVPGSAVPADQLVSNSGEVKPVLVYYQYVGDTVDAVEKNLNFIPDNVVATPDRFAQGALCYEFNGSTSKVIANDITDFPKTDFAILFWAKSSATSQMEAMRIIGSDTAVVIVGVNGGGVLTVTWNSVVVATMSVTTGARLLTDGFWHHITVQRYSNSLQLFVDGVACGAFRVSQALPVNPTMQIGGGGELGGWNGAIDDTRLYNRAFPAASIPQAVYQWTQVKAISATDNLAEYYPFNGNALNDLGHGVDGVPFNVTPTTDRHGTLGAAYLFNGVNSYIALNQPFSSTGGDFAIGFWEQSSVTSSMTAVSASSGGGNGSSFDFVFNSGAALTIELNGAPLAALSIGAVGGLTNNAWHFILLQRTGATLQLYVDGAIAGSVEDESIFFGQASVVQFGRGSGASSVVANYWNGALDDIQIYETALTPQQILSAEGLQFRPRDGAGALTFEGKMWLLGGWNPGDVPTTNSQVWSSTDGVNWGLVTTAPWEGRHDAGYAVLNNKMWIVGGDKNSGHYQNDVWSSSDGVTWDLVTSNVPWANRATQYVLAFDNRLWLMGGQQIFEVPGPVVAYNDVYSSVDGATWQLETPNAAWSRRGIMMGNVVFQGRMWVIGGGQYDVRTFNNDVWSSADGIAWKQVLANAPWTARQFHNITVFDNKIWVLAGGDGESQGGLNDVWYSTDGATWTQLEGSPWISRHAASVFVQNNYLWLACGSDVSTYNDVWKMGYAS